ncbi:MAG: thioredoxin family protein [Verrucomicrobia bacterium]|nr:thioredoxin family protein [Verrucomicrobiota bacterium]
MNAAIVLAVASAAAGVLVLKRPAESRESAPRPPAITSPGEQTEASSAATLPTLVDLGAGKCIPCKKMAPILDALKEEYAGRMNVVFHDVWKDPEPAEKYGIRLIPTQVFLAPDGKELFRHEGFYGAEDIVGKWKELGYSLENANSE